MLIFTYKLERYIKNKIIPKILITSDPKNYQIKGSFRRRIPYITDIDIVNNVYPEYNSDNIYEKLRDLITNLSNYPKIKLIYVTCGYDERFRLTDNLDSFFKNIKSLLTPQEILEIQTVIDTHPTNIEKQAFFINEIIWDLYKIRWTPQEVLENSKILRGGIKINFEETIKNNSSFLLQYYVKIEIYPIGFDVLVNYEKVDLISSYNNAAFYQLKLANYSREYYYMLFPFRYYFKKNPTIVKQLEFIIENKFGIYKQLMVRIETYQSLYKSNNLDIETAKSIIISIIHDVMKLKDFQTNTIQQIQNVAMDNTPEIKMHEWNILLGKLYTEINDNVNSRAKKYFFKYLNLIPKSERCQFYLKNCNESKISSNNQSRIVSTKNNEIKLSKQFLKQYYLF
ncbi:Chain A [Cotonvirus japonicus]|uniref:Chain A n=1 Tax=Cotonvirus japonicus TaxID=2811091 RepID=A0ABM7NT51_9VIRU|nr:Chain A [Cotonvirus japonicus]BCS83342.1 Chain A [Cotonvirus japonicus]